MKVKNLIGALVLGISGASLASVEDPGFYVGSGLGEAEAQDASEYGLSNDTDTAFRIYGGYEFSRLLTAEIGYLNLGDYTGTIPSIEGPAATRVELDGFSIGLRPQIALNENWFAQVQIGVFLWEADAQVRSPVGIIRANDDGEDPYYGLGFGRSFGPSWQVSGEWTRFETDESDVDFINLALTYRIGR